MAAVSVSARASEHPVLASVTAAALFIIVVPGVAAGAVVAVLNVIGFGPAGVCAGE